MHYGRMANATAMVCCLAISCFVSPAQAGARQFKILYSFCALAGCPDGARPNGLVEDQAGDLYGTAYEGGAYGKGTVFELIRRVTGRYRYKVLYSFCGAGGYCLDGWSPDGPLILDSAGNLYGLTILGGSSGYGVAFELLKGAKNWSLAVLYNFCSQGNCIDGSAPITGLAYAGAQTGALYDGTSPLYGVTMSGGLSQGYGYGVAFELQPGESGWLESVLHAFGSEQNWADGIMPLGTLVEDASGNLYGTTEAGGNSGNEGTVFQLSSNGTNWTETVLYDFCSIANCADGGSPYGGLAMDGSGNLFGETTLGGNSCTFNDLGCGVVFELAHNGTAWQETVAHGFCAKANCPDGATASGSVLQADGQGNFYGAALQGGNLTNKQNGGGTVFELSGSGYRVLHRFCNKPNCVDGFGPAGLIRDPGGFLFGVAEGGANNQGIIYELTP